MICLVTTTLVDHVCAYVINPHTILLNFVMFCLAYALHVDGEVKGRPLYTIAATEELMVYVLWLTVSHGLRSVFAIWLCLSVYDRIVRPSIHIQQESAYFIAGESQVFSYIIPGESYKNVLYLVARESSCQEFVHKIPRVSLSRVSLLNLAPVNIPYCR